MVKNLSDDERQKQASQGNEQAFKALFDRYRTRLFQYVFKMVKSKEAAEELVMDVFLKLWLAKEMLPEIENLDGFLFRVAYNKTIDFFRAAAKDKQFADLLWETIQTPSQLDADASLLRQEYEWKLREAINLLSPQRKKIFNLSREEGFTHAQIAEELGISKNTVANTIVEASQFIKAYLAKNFNLLLLISVLDGLLNSK